jgi:hypothetical protein
MKAYGGVEVQLLTSTLVGDGQPHAPIALPPQKQPRFPLDRRPVGFQYWSGPYGEEKNI